MKIENTEKAEILLKRRGEIVFKLKRLEDEKKFLKEGLSYDFEFGIIRLSPDDNVTYEIEIARLMFKHALEQKLNEIDKAIKEM